MYPIIFIYNLIWYSSMQLSAVTTVVWWTVNWWSYKIIPWIDKKQEIHNKNAFTFVIVFFPWCKFFPPNVICFWNVRSSAVLGEVKDILTHYCITVSCQLDDKEHSYRKSLVILFFCFTDKKCHEKVKTWFPGLVTYTRVHILQLWYTINMQFRLYIFLIPFLPLKYHLLCFFLLRASALLFSILFTIANQWNEISFICALLVCIWMTNTVYLSKVYLVNWIWA